MLLHSDSQEGAPNELKSAKNTEKWALRDKITMKQAGAELSQTQVKLKVIAKVGVELELEGDF